MNIEDLTIKKFNKGFINKEFSALEVAEEFFRKIEKKDKEIGAYITLLKDEALLAAERADLALSRGEETSPLTGVPIAVKDNILIKGSRTTAASRILNNYVASYDAGVIKKLKKQMAVFLGKTNLDEFAMGSSTENSGLGLTRNPLDLDRVPGGSSGGSAAAVAAGEAVAALGSDTGGSIRQPAAFCGVVGLKPTYGAVSRHGLIAMASSLDQIGPITKTVEDAAILFNFIRGKDIYDATSRDFDFDEIGFNELKNLTVGIPKEYFSDDLDRDVTEGVERAIQALKSLGLKFKEVSLPYTEYALACYYIIMPAEVSTNLARFDGIRYNRTVEGKSLRDIYFKERGEGFGAEAKRRILLGTFVLSAGYYDAYYGKAQKVRALIKGDFDKVFKEVDLLVTPTTPTPAFKIGEKIKDPLSMYLSDIFTVPANLAGVPALSVPVSNYFSKDNLPVSFQLIGNYWQESVILGVGRYYEKIAKQED